MAEAQQSLVGIGIAVTNAAPAFGHFFSPLPSAGTDLRMLTARFIALARQAGKEIAFRSCVGPRATREGILQLVRDALPVVAPGGTLVVIVQGHGIEVDDNNGDEAVLGWKFDQVLPTADLPIRDDDFLPLWLTRPDITIFAVSDTCMAESNIFFDIQGFADLRRLAHRLAARRASASFSDPPLIRSLRTTSGPRMIQFAASARGTNAFDAGFFGRKTGRLTNSVLNSSATSATLATYMTWFRAIHDRMMRENEALSPDRRQTPVLFYRAVNGDDSIVGEPSPFAVRP